MSKISSRFLFKNIIQPFWPCPSRPWPCYLLLNLLILAGCPQNSDETTPPSEETESEEAPECVENEDCDDRDPCTTGSCVDGQCRWERMQREAVLLTTIETETPALDVCLSSSRWLHIAVGENGLETYDLNSIPDEPALLAHRIPTSSAAQGVSFMREHLFAMTTNGEIEVFPSGATAPISRYKALAQVRALTRVDDLVVASLHSKGLEIIDYSDLSNPQRSARVETPGRPEQTIRHGSSLHVADGLGGVAFIDFRDRNEPVLLPERRLPTEGRVMGISIRPPYYILAELGAGLGIIDMDQPDVERLSVLPLGGSAHDLGTLSPHTAIVAAGNAGLVMVDIIDHAKPHILWTIPFNGPATRLSRQGERIAVAIGESGAAVVELNCSSDSD